MYRVCTPFPFEANLTVTAAQRDMELHIDNFEAFVYFSPGTRCASPQRVHADAAPRNRPTACGTRQCAGDDVLSSCNYVSRCLQAIIPCAMFLAIVTHCRACEW